MKNRLKFIIPGGIVLVAIVVLVVLNPLGWGSLAPGANSTSPSNTGENADNNLGGNDEGEQTNPVPQGEEVVPITFRVSPGKFFIDDEHEGSASYAAGTSVERQLLITNKNAFDATFSVDYRIPDNVIEGYSRPTSEVRDWVWISNRKPTIPAGETMTITIRLGMPSYATPPGDKWEFWIGVIDKSQTGWIRTELANRWLVTMK